MDVKAAAENIPVCNIPTYGTTAVAQMTFALLLEICHHVAEHSDAVKKGNGLITPTGAFWKYPLMELAGKKMGIIASAVLDRLLENWQKAFGMQVLAYDAYQNESGKRSPIM